MVVAKAVIEFATACRVCAKECRSDGGMFPLDDARQCMAIIVPRRLKKLPDRFPLVARISPILEPLEHHGRRFASQHVGRPRIAQKWRGSNHVLVGNTTHVIVQSRLTSQCFDSRLTVRLSVRPINESRRLYSYSSWHH